jgi:hypothetical protein
MKPKTIFKYESFSAQSLCNLKCQSLFFGSPLRFNDPYDCNVNAAAKDPSDEELRELRDFYSRKEDAPDDLKSADMQTLRRLITESGNRTLRELSSSFIASKGITCFSEHNDDLLMWGHYGGRNKGFCLEFSTDRYPFSEIKKVKYATKLPEYDLVPGLLGKDDNQVEQLYCTKPKPWEYEKEWRLIHREANTLFSYHASSLRAVYFGPGMDRQSLEIVCLILAGQNPDVELWEGSINRNKYQIDFKKFIYKNHLDANGSNGN